MKITEWVKKKKEEFHESSRRKKEIDQIKKEAYYKKMKEQAAWMGEKQAELEAKNRAAIYAERLIEKKKQIKRKLNSTHDPSFKGMANNPFGLRRDFQEYDIITGQPIK